MKLALLAAACAALLNLPIDLAKAESNIILGEVFDSPNEPSRGAAELPIVKVIDVQGAQKIARSIGNEIQKKEKKDEKSPPGEGEEPRAKPTSPSVPAAKPEIKPTSGGDSGGGSSRSSPSKNDKKEQLPEARERDARGTGDDEDADDVPKKGGGKKNPKSYSYRPKFGGVAMDSGAESHGHAFCYMLAVSGALSAAMAAVGMML